MLLGSWTRHTQTRAENLVDTGHAVTTELDYRVLRPSMIRDPGPSDAHPSGRLTAAGEHLAQLRL